MKSANKAGFYPRKNSKSTNNEINYKKPWYNNKCYKLRNKYHNAENNYSKNKSLSNKNKLAQYGKENKKALKKCRLNYYNNLNDKLRTMKTSNTKDFW